ncbi:hypothetical protein [Natronoglycomyces albus]|uniref:DUF4878 domain-containing protein n=1 Tax=Natronoglycomyces albus TaxID=2811108 RepID=A0A895XMZ0_9ACTN|nr:hypothetical protein [Natronoglycomyces albus]QSB04405.1 hypothetical protein JQS30_11445 [Natronoglycomyces albus]
MTDSHSGASASSEQAQQPSSDVTSMPSAEQQPHQAAASDSTANSQAPAGLSTNPASDSAADQPMTGQPVPGPAAALGGPFAAQSGQPGYHGPPPPDFDGDIVPFAAPPKERNSTRFTLALVGGILGAVLLCGGVIFAVVTMTFQLESAVREEVVAVTDQFLEDIEQQRYQSAYESLCNSKRDEADQRVYEREWQGWDTSGWTADISRVSQTAAGDLLLPVEFADGQEWLFEISFDGGDNLLDIQVCDWERD